MEPKLILLPYQLDYLRHNGSSIYIKSRQIGLSFICAFKHVLRACNDKPRSTFYSATDEIQARNWISYCRNICQQFNIPLIEDSSQKLTFPNGSIIVGLSSNPKSIHGKSADIVIDEAGLHEDFEELIKAAIPCQTWGYDVDIISTISTPIHGFYQMYLECANGGKMSSKFKAFKTDLYDAVKQGLAQRIYETKYGKTTYNIKECNKQFIDEIRNGCSTHIFNSQYLCLPSDSTNFIVPLEVYKSMAKSQASPIIPDGLGELYAGIDVGRSKNYTVLWVIQKTKQDNTNYYKTVCVRHIQNMDINSQITVLKDICRGKNIKKIAIDQGLFGCTIVDEMKKEFNSIVPISFGQKNKQEMAELLRTKSEKKLIEFPTDDLIMTDVCSLCQNTTKAGTVSYGGGIGDGHADFAWALAMALTEAEKCKPLMWAMSR